MLLCCLICKTKLPFLISQPQLADMLITANVNVAHNINKYTFSCRNSRVQTKHAAYIFGLLNIGKKEAGLETFSNK